MKKNIYIAYTGGTIGMKQSGMKENTHGYIPVAGHLSEYLKALPELYRAEMPNFTLHEYQPILDSSNMGPAEWQIIADDIKKNYDQYDGFVVLHGTDTMAYTCSALSFLIENLSKPIIVTGSLIPLSQLRSDGQVNLLNALYLAANYPINQVSLFFNGTLYQGNRCTKVCNDGFNAFNSPNKRPLLEMGVKVKLIAEEIAPVYSTTNETNTIASTKVKFNHLIPQEILVLHFYPGINPEFISLALKQPLNAVILRSFGSGNLPQNEHILKCLKDAKQRGIVIINNTQCIQGTVAMESYAAGSALGQNGVISGLDMTLEATLAKLHYLLSQDLSYEQVCALLLKNLRGELSE